MPRYFPLIYLIIIINKKNYTKLTSKNQKKLISRIKKKKMKKFKKKKIKKKIMRLFKRENLFKNLKIQIIHGII